MQKYLFLLPLFVIVQASAQNTTFSASAPPAVVKGEQFRLAFTLKNGEGSNAQFPSEIKGFDILYGPGFSSGSNSSNETGRWITETTETYTFTLLANETGTFSVPAATIKSEGKTYTSKALVIKVLPPDKNTQRPQQEGGNGSTSSSTTQNIKSNDAFIRAIVSKSRVYEQEAFMITFRLYTTLEIRSLGKIEFPEFEGFMVEDQELPVNQQLSREHYNGRNYYTADLKKSLLFPQRSGVISIPQGKIETVFLVPSGRRIPSLGGYQEIMTDVIRVLTTNPVTINVSPLPANKPSGFANAVGSFSMKPAMSATEATANEAITLTLNISGTGNLKLIKTPELKLPTDFESYDPKVNNNLKVTSEGLSGSKTIEYLFIPRHQGQYTIPAVEFSYFDTKSRTYKTLKSPEYHLSIAKDPNAGAGTAVSYNEQNEVEAIQDIRFLKTGDIAYIKENDFLVASFGYWLWYLIPALLLIVSYIFYRKQIEQNANIALMKTKKANKVATKRLKVAGLYLNQHNKEKFYEEILRATWGYLSDKLVIPVAGLNRNNIEIELTNYGVSGEVISKFMYILDTGEFARYAPSESEEAMDKLYAETVSAISEMENVIKKKFKVKG